MLVAAVLLVARAGDGYAQGVVDQDLAFVALEDAAIAGDSFEQVVGLAVVGPAFGDLNVEILSPALDGVAAAFGSLAMVIAANFHRMAQGVHVLVSRCAIPEPEEAG